MQTENALACYKCKKLINTGLINFVLSSDGFPDVLAGKIESIEIEPEPV